MAVRSLPLLAAGALVALAAGCNETIYVYDDLDLELDLDLTPPRVDEDLHTPYVLGADVRISVGYSDEDEVGVARWTASIEDQSIFRVDSSWNPGDGPTIEGKAVGAGVTYLVVRDGDGDLLTRQPIEVRVPDEARLYAHGWILVDREPESRVAEARVVAGGTATYLVRWFAGGQELYGNGALDVVVPGEAVTATPRTSFLTENREWITFTSPDTPGVHTLTLRALGVPVAPIEVVVVPRSDVARVEIHGQDERGAHSGDRFVALAQAYDAQDRRLFGIAYDWQVNGVEQLGEGDLYRYEYLPGALDLLTATSGDHQASAMLHVGDGYVDSSNNVGCSVAPGAAPRPLLALLLLVGTVFSCEVLSRNHSVFRRRRAARDRGSVAT